MPRQSPSLDRATPELIARTALSIVDRDGPQALSFRSVADRLNISHATVQRRCTDIAGLLDLCTDHLAAEIPEVAPETDWAEATEIRFRALYELLVAHPGLVALRGARPWLGPQLLARLTEPAVAANLARGMAPAEAMATYRRMYLLTLGCASFVDHRAPRDHAARTRAALAALDPEAFPALTGHVREILPVLTDHEVFHSALRQLVAAAGPAAAR
ncbi:TetR/AcrR family transcriptional regulator C-terminal domain-containing protein [Streptomyces sp. NPDC091272]|uniref:TetR/AcrR family transcriptional regulator C-terminal domain-containing protein n=1 Tax=Streptomyces sp. NPDC091272 TaxID=3365981 RepID=UPI003815F6C1